MTFRTSKAVDRAQPTTKATTPSKSVRPHPSHPMLGAQSAIGNHVVLKWLQSPNELVKSIAPSTQPLIFRDTASRTTMPAVAPNKEQPSVAETGAPLSNELEANSVAGKSNKCAVVPAVTKGVAEPQPVVTPDVVDQLQKPIVTLPQLGEGPFDGDIAIANFAHELAQCFAGSVRYLKNGTKTKIDAVVLEKELADDYAATMQVLKGTWLKVQQTKIDALYKRLTKPRARNRKGAELSANGVTDWHEVADAMKALESLRYRLQQQILDDFAPSYQRAWMIGVREKLLAQTNPMRAKVLEKGGLHPSYYAEQGVREDIPFEMWTRKSKKGDIKKDRINSRVAPELIEFLTLLHATEPNFTADSYPNHGGQNFLESGFSVDIVLTGADGEKDDRGFWMPATATRFLLSVNETAKQLKAQWAVLYNDAGVQDAVNTATGYQNVAFQGKIGEKGKINWHGPAPLKLHFHLDLKIPQGTTASQATALSSIPSPAADAAAPAATIEADAIIADPTTDAAP